MATSQTEMLHGILQRYQKHSPVQVLLDEFDTVHQKDNLSLIEFYQQSIEVLEKYLWQSGMGSKELRDYQQIFKELESLYSVQPFDNRHDFMIVIPVADRPKHLQLCLTSILELCQNYGYGGIKDGCYHKIGVLVVDDSKDAASLKKHRELANEFSQQGLKTEYLDQYTQRELINQLTDQQYNELQTVFGDIKQAELWHKGASVSRNIAYLKLCQLAEKNDKLLFYFIDSDQEFKVKIQQGQHETDIAALNYFYYLDRLFTETSITIATGKVVGDPPVSPAVMAGKFLDDISSFLTTMSALPAEQACQFHKADQDKADDASYHDMANLFGFEVSQSAFQYHCQCPGDHNHIACFNEFTEKLSHFFDGEHPTRKTYYQYQNASESVTPARTIYTGNYIFKASGKINGLDYFIPFSTLKLRMAGPVLGRLIKTEIGENFVSINLPMLHKRTITESGQSEFRAGVKREKEVVDLSTEFERQFFGDVMLFTIESLTADSYPQKKLSQSAVEEILKTIEKKLYKLYMEKHQQIMQQLASLKQLFETQEYWWNNIGQLNSARTQIRHFIQNIDVNFGKESRAYMFISDESHRKARRKEILQAIMNYKQSRLAWNKVCNEVVQ